jgi:hypothetical protein
MSGAVTEEELATLRLELGRVVFGRLEERRDRGLFGSEQRWLGAPVFKGPATRWVQPLRA